MSANTSPIFQLVSAAKGTQFTSADTTTAKTILTAGSNGTRVDSISVCSNDTAAINLRFFVNDGSTDFYLGVVAIAIGAGYTTVVKVEAIHTIAPTLGYLFLKSGWTLKASCLATMTAAKTCDIVVQGGDY